MLHMFLVLPTGKIIISLPLTISLGVIAEVGLEKKSQKEELPRDPDQFSDLGSIYNRQHGQHGKGMQTFVNVSKEVAGITVTASTFRGALQ